MDKIDTKNLYNYFSKGNILFLGCHLDDIEYGCGGLIARLTAIGLKDNIFYCTLSNFNKSSEGKVTIKRDLDEAYRAIEKLGIKNENVIIKDIPAQLFQSYAQNIREILLELRDSIIPNYVFFPSQNDIHQDHKALHDEGIRVFRNVNCLGYEIIRSCYQFLPNTYIEIDMDDLAKKINAIKEYKSQVSQTAGYYFDEELIKSICIFRGGQSGKKLAEAYELYFSHL